MLTILNIARQEEKLFSQEIIRSIKPQLDALIDAAEQEDAEEHKFEGEVQKEIQGSKIQPNTKQPGNEFSSVSLNDGLNPMPMQDQGSFVCYSCRPSETRICLSCASLCHKGHDISFSK